MELRTRIYNNPFRHDETDKVVAEEQSNGEWVITHGFGITQRFPTARDLTYWAKSNGLHRRTNQEVS